MVTIKKMLATAGVVALLLPSTALAQDRSGDEGYGSPNLIAGLEEGSGSDRNPKQAQAQAADRGDLPFTGADLGVLGAAGGILLALGFGLRRLTHRPFEA
jgi:hypothetical protein